MPMRKYLGAFQAKPEFDTDEIWKHQTGAIAPCIRFLAAHRMQKYFVRRVINVESGDPGFFDLVEIYWTSEDLEKEYYDYLFSDYQASGLTPPMVAWTKWIIPFWNTTEEVIEVLEPEEQIGNDVKLYKTMTAFQIPDGADGDEVWKYLEEKFAPEARKLAGDLFKRFIIHRPVAVAAGDPSSFYAINEVWWTSKAARSEYEKLAQNLTADLAARTIPEPVWSVEIETFQLA